MTAPTSPIRTVSDTAMWIAAYRADESDRPDAIFRDPYARRAGARARYRQARAGLTRRTVAKRGGAC